MYKNFFSNDKNYREKKRKKTNYKAQKLYNFKTESVWYNAQTLHRPALVDTVEPVSGQDHVIRQHMASGMSYHVAWSFHGDKLEVVDPIFSDIAGHLIGK